MSKQANIALYRKYRPETWEEVLGQEHIVSVLKESAKQKKISHAYLFAGSRGIGKTSVARILAREAGVTPNDIYEMDAASNRGIDDVRALREAVNVLPLESPYKVYIVDEAHMLTKEAFNALLKTLEEPPKHVIFILATTEIEKLPETIVSRCQVFTFKKPSHAILKKTVLDAAKKEGLKIDESSADLIALLGDGSFRDAYGVLQKVAGLSGDKNLSREEVEKILGVPAGDLVGDFVAAISEKDVAKGLAAIAKAVEQNIDMKIYAKLVLRALRAALLLRFAPETEKNLSAGFSEKELLFLKGVAGDKKSSINSAVLSEFLDASQNVSRSYIPELPLEISLIKICSGEQPLK